jgi:hypothetical protein
VTARDPDFRIAAATLTRVRVMAMRASRGVAGGAGLLAFSLALSACPVPSAPGAEGVAAMPAAPPPAADPADELLAALVEIGPRAAGSPALARAREWANGELAAYAPPSAAARSVILVTTSLEGDGNADEIAERSSGAAAVLGAARALARAEPPLGFEVAFLAGAPGSPEWLAALGPPERVAAADLVVFVGRACGLPQRRDLLSHRVLRERFLRAAVVQPPPGAFEQAEAPHAALTAAGARRVLAVDAPASGGDCSPAATRDALARFLRDADELFSTSRQGAGSVTPQLEATNSAAAPTF